MHTKIIFTFLAIIFFYSGAHAKNTLPGEGKIIFTARCAACHNANVKIVGPALANVDQRHSMEWIVKFVHSSQALIKNNDREAVAIFNEFSQTVMPDHPDLSGDQVKNVVDYIKSQTKVSGESDGEPFKRPGELTPSYLPVSITNYSFFGIYLSLIFIMIACMVVAVRVKEMQRENNEKKKDIFI